jgi:DNA-binding SARP family transcriptional activator
MVIWATDFVNGKTAADLVSSVFLAGASQDLLADWYDEWVLVERERFRQLRLHALERACQLLLEDGRYPMAIMAGLAAVAAEPLRESAHRLVVQAHIGEGNPYEAYRQYRAYAELLDAELGLKPSGAMRTLVEPLVSHGFDEHLRAGGRGGN